MAQYKSREQRGTVFLRAEMRHSGRWSGAVICNVSSRGLMGKCAQAPQQGADVEVRYNGYTMEGRVVWSQGMRFGIRTWSKIDLVAIGVERQTSSRGFVEESRSTAALAGSNAPRARAKSAEDARQLGRKLDWSLMVIVAAVAAGLVAVGSATVLGEPSAKVTAAMQKE